MNKDELLAAIRRFEYALTEANVALNEAAASARNVHPLASQSARTAAENLIVFINEARTILNQSVK